MNSTASYRHAVTLFAVVNRAGRLGAKELLQHGIEHRVSRARISDEPGTAHMNLDPVPASSFRRNLGRIGATPCHPRILAVKSHDVGMSKPP